VRLGVNRSKGSGDGVCNTSSYLPLLQPSVVARTSLSPTTLALLPSHLVAPLPHDCPSPPLHVSHSVSPLFRSLM
jgi:hypothetical protein